MQQQQITTWASAIAVIATMLGCSEPAMMGNPLGAGGTGAPLGMGGAGAGAAGAVGSAGNSMSPGTAGMSNMSAAGSAGSTTNPGTAGTTPANNGGSGGMDGMPMAGASGESAAGAGGGGEAGSGSEPGQVTNCGTVESTDLMNGKGPFTPTIMMNGGASGSSWVFYPMELGRDGCKHPIFNWGPGAGTGPSNYRDHLNHLASHGFVIISQPSSGNGGTEKASLEWLMKQNDTMSSPFFQKLDLTKVVMGGHSLGALTTFAMADYEPLTHYVLVCGGSFGAPTGADKIHGPTIILGGDTDSGTPNFEDDYDAIPTPVIFLIKSGTDHIQCARNNLEPWTAFLRWQLYGETKWKADFFMGGKYCKAPWNSCESKGW